jgi:hypothetical protein
MIKNIKLIYKNGKETLIPLPELDEFRKIVKHKDICDIKFLS